MMWETVKELVFSRNIIALILVAIMLVLTLHLITHTGRIVVYLIVIGLLGACVYYFFPDFVATIQQMVESRFSG